MTINPDSNSMNTKLIPLHREIVFSPELGLAIEKLKDGFTLDSLWQVLPPEDPTKKGKRSIME